MKKGYVVVENGPVFEGQWLGGVAKAGELVFNTSHSGYEEIATDPSYFGQIMVMTAPQQGNYGVDRKDWESENLWIQGFVCLEVEPLERTEETWSQRLATAGIPILSGVDTRRLVLFLRENGTKMGAVVAAESESQARELASPLIESFKTIDADWAFQVATDEIKTVVGDVAGGKRVALVDFGCKTNIVRELKKRCGEIRVYPPRTPAQHILDDKPDGVMLSNGPGSPANVEAAVGTIQALLGQQPIFGICMGHQLLGLALGGKTYKLKFGHRGANHPVKNLKSGEVYVTSQNHGYAIEEGSLPKTASITHRNLNDGTVSGLESEEHRCFSLQFHPENHPGPREATKYFDQFLAWMQA